MYILIYIRSSCITIDTSDGDLLYYYIAHSYICSGTCIPASSAKHIPSRRDDDAADPAADDHVIVLSPPLL